ncbi:MAG: ASCH domain-containing protein [Lachnospiraceae bacterium]|nr:ASCH domain-containing protein [Lachnospiraceae bacterium]
MLILPIKKKWFDMLLSGDKLEDYREIKRYWGTRIIKRLSFPLEEIVSVKELLARTLRSLSIGTGKSEWGEALKTEYYRFRIKSILRKE